MPVDLEPVFVIEGAGKDRFVTDEGEVSPPQDPPHAGEHKRSRNRPRGG